MPTMGDSPKASARLIEISPSEVSAVDMPAIGEPHFIVKGMKPGYDPKDNSIENKGDQMPSPVKKLDESAVPRPVMKAIKTRLDRAIDSVGELQAVAKNLKVAEDGEARYAPAVVVGMAKSLAAEIRSLLPDAEVPVYKRGQATSVLSLHTISKRAKDVEKANAVSYLMRDQYVSVTQSITEYLTTYVDGIEADDDGPMLIPVALEETVDKTAASLEELADEYPADESLVVSDDSPVQAEDTQKSALITKDGIDFGGEFVKLNKSIAAIPGMISKAVAKIVETSLKEKDMSQETQDTEVVDDDQETTDTDVETSEETDVEETDTEETGGDEGDDVTPEPVEKTDDPILKALAAMESRMNKKLKIIEKSVEDVRGVAQAADEKVEKAMKRRADSKGGEQDSTTKVTTKDKDDPASFKNILKL